MLLLGAFGVAALAMTAIGLYGVVSFTVSHPALRASRVDPVVALRYE